MKLLETKAVCRKAKIPPKSLPYWSLRAGVTFFTQEIRRGRVVSLWAPTVVKAILRARKAVAATK